MPARRPQAISRRKRAPLHELHAAMAVGRHGPAPPRPHRFAPRHLPFRRGSALPRANLTSEKVVEEEGPGRGEGGGAGGRRGGGEGGGGGEAGERMRKGQGGEEEAVRDAGGGADAG
ncbi:hypothetical protein PVAP13_2NG256024 [Panicum virgatum]|uniref:Uncharacterized protein n=1 Tax=Panicum virgatum TaxID=38727 RepID=A0A8T0VKZ1_PANVG|nr:hypothetical protein PVAP13_2NG256024 [Panicum virgatum]